MWASLLMILAHGASSSGLFYGISLIYSRRNSRIISISPGLGNYSPILRIFWFVLCVANIGGPPTINLLIEASVVVASTNWCELLFVPIGTIVFMAMLYRIVIYSSTQHGQVSSKIARVRPISFLGISVLQVHVLCATLGVCFISFSS